MEKFCAISTSKNISRRQMKLVWDPMMYSWKLICISNVFIRANGELLGQNDCATLIHFTKVEYGHNESFFFLLPTSILPQPKTLTIYPENSTTMDQESPSLNINNSFTIQEQDTTTSEVNAIPQDEPSSFSYSS